MTLLDIVLEVIPKETLAEALKRTEERRQQLEDAIRWALGEGKSNFGQFTDNATVKSKPYWWRTELRERAGLETAPERKG